MPDDRLPGTEPFATSPIKEEIPLPLEAATQATDGTSPKRRRRRRSAAEFCLIAIGLCILVLLGTLCAGLFSLVGGVNSLFAVGGTRANPPAGTYSVISVEGGIQTGNASGYQHSATLQYIQKMQEDEGNLGILLYMNTGGGGVYESDEVYRALMEYKEATGRPVWAYMARTCASGGYYICAAADYIVANHNTTTGSIGVYYQFTDTSGLYEKLGVETVLIRSGDNKGIGVQGAEITDANRAVYQSMVDEYYARFVSIIASGRGMGEAAVKTLADGRPYTALQAQANGLVDELDTWDNVKAAFEDEVGGGAYVTSFQSASAFTQLVRSISGLLPKSESQSLQELAETTQTGLMAEMTGLQ